ncbi:copper amine oxidase N-terminal domain-containing protein [Paenibacillus sp. D51F]
MNKLAIGLTAFVIGAMGAMGPLKSAAAASNNAIIQPKLSIEVLVNARKVQFPDSKPQMVNNTVLIPLRFVSEKLNVKLSLSGKAITMVKGDKTVKLTIGAKTASVNGKTITLGASATATNGRTMVPLRFISEAFGETVEWDNITQFVWIGNKEVPKVEDLTTAVDIKKYKSYYGDRDYLLNAYTEQQGKISLNKALVLSSKDLPFKIGPTTYYRFDLANSKSGEKYIRATSTDHTAIGLQLLYLISDSPARLRMSVSDWDEGNKEISVRYTPITSRADLDQLSVSNWSNLKPTDIDYLHITRGIPFAVLLKPEWSE